MSDTTRYCRPLNVLVFSANVTSFDNDQLGNVTQLNTASSAAALTNYGRHRRGDQRQQLLRRQRRRGEQQRAVHAEERDQPRQRLRHLPGIAARPRQLPDLGNRAPRAHQPHPRCARPDRARGAADQHARAQGQYLRHHARGEQRHGADSGRDQHRDPAAHRARAGHHLGARCERRLGRPDRFQGDPADRHQRQVLRAVGSVAAGRGPRPRPVGRHQLHDRRARTRSRSRPTSSRRTRAASSASATSSPAPTRTAPTSTRATTRSTTPTTPAASSSAPTARPRTRRARRPTTSPAASAQILKDPLYYAAKYGGFTDVNANNLPDQTIEWDSKKTRRQRRQPTASRTTTSR